VKVTLLASVGGAVVLVVLANVLGALFR